MITFFLFASGMALMVAWLLVWPILSTQELSKKEKQKALFFILLGIVVFPLIFYIFLAH